MIITISGRQGADKTTLAKKLSKMLNMNFISIGDLQGKIAESKGITVNRLMEIGKTEPWVHKEIDRRTIELGKTEDNFIIEGWIAFHFIPNSIKIFLDVNKKMGAKRIFNDPRPDETPVLNLEEMEKTLEKRLKDSEVAFKKIYGADFLDLKNYDIIIDTTNLSVEEMTTEAIKKIKEIK